MAKLRRPDLKTLRQAKRSGMTRVECWALIRKGVEQNANMRLSEKAMSLALWKERIEAVFGKEVD